jgi:16S rRNA (guanine1516-N2)-methyltransferase
MREAAAPVHTHAVTHRIAVAAGPAASDGDRRAASELSARLHLPLLADDASAHLLIISENGRLALYEPAARTRLFVEYTVAELRRYRASAGRDPLIRAVGPHARDVVDATGGLGRDAVHLAWAGRHVVAIERDPIVAALLHDILDRAIRNGALQPGEVELLAGDATALLGGLRPRPEVVYLDPMFPVKRRTSAAARKEMRLVRLLVGEGADAGELFHAARQAATERVVVKRPDDAPPLIPHPTASYAGKLVRYDVYRAVRAP